MRSTHGKITYKVPYVYACTLHTALEQTVSCDSPGFDDVNSAIVDTLQVLLTNVLRAQVNTKSTVIGVDDVNELVVAVDRHQVVLTGVRQSSFTKQNRTDRRIIFNRSFLIINLLKVGLHRVSQKRSKNTVLHIIALM